MIAGLIPHRYAKALFKFAADSDSSARVYGEMQDVISAFRADARLEKVMANPYVARDDKRKLLLDAAGTPGDAYTRFVSLILDHNREEFAYLMALAYCGIYRKQNNISQVRITTAAQLPAAELDKLKALVRKASPSEVTYEYSVAVDDSLIGGFVIDVDSTRMDASISSELEQLRQNLSSN